MIILGIDYGTKNIGIAVGQKITKTAQALKTIKVKKKKNTWDEIKKILTEWKPYCIIIGLPLKHNGNKQKITIKAENFAKKIKKKYNIKVKLHDERYSTKEARSLLFNQGGLKLIKKKIHSVSATLILESWLKRN